MSPYSAVHNSFSVFFLIPQKNIFHREYFFRSSVIDSDGTFPKRESDGGEMADKQKNELLHDHNHDGIDRRGFLKCMAWAGTGAFCVMNGGVLKSWSLSRIAEMG